MNSPLHVFTDSQADNASIGEPRSLQNLALQRDTFAEAGCGQIFTERLSGALTDRPALREALEFARRGDTLMADPDIPIIQIAQRLGVSPPTLYGTSQLRIERNRFAVGIG